MSENTLEKQEKLIANPPTEAQAVAQEIVEESPAAQQVLRHLAIRRATSALFLIAALGLFLLWLPESNRYVLVRSLIANRFLIILLLLFATVMMSLLWSKGQTLDVWLFKGLNISGYEVGRMDRIMWIATQIGNVGFAFVVAVISYILGDHRFAIGFALGSLTLLLLVTVIKAFADRARPFNMMLEARVVGWREAGLSFPSGHTTQTFFMMTLATLHFQLPLAVAAVLYGIATLVGITRVYLGVHYPRDVMAGAILGLIWGTVGMLVAPYL
jgi:membrane-associated phospholipid phosphatase